MSFELQALPSPMAVTRHRRKRTISDLTVQLDATQQASGAQHKLAEERPKSLLRTPEFFFYYVVFILAVPVMAWLPISVSSTSHPNYNLYQHKLSEGWMGRPIDNSDMQYRSFRNNIPVLTLAACVYLGTKKLFLLLRNQKTSLKFNLVASFILISALHGTSTLKILIILTINYLIARLCGARQIGPLLTWLFSGAVLFANDRYSGYSFTKIIPSLGYLDNYQGIYGRWYILFNLTMLRMVSFNLDYFWACRKGTPPQITDTLGAKERPKQEHSVDAYTYSAFLSYALYPPLYIAGPIITFNDYLWQIRFPPPIHRSYTISYACRLFICTLTMELILHYMYMVAIKDTKAWIGLTPAEICMVGFWNLIIVWLKLLIPWRAFRLWSLLDGVDPPENMIRCMANNYSTLGFWRSWHRSYNQWIIRYIYVPLGGTQHLLRNSLLVFTFVALWHDLTFRLLAWGWLVTLFILPEVAARYLLPPSQYGKNWWYRHVCAIGAVFNIFMMMAANLVGFVIGTDGLAFFVKQTTSTVEGWIFLAVTFPCLFVGAQLMFEYREEEMRQGIFRRC